MSLLWSDIRYTWISIEGFQPLRPTLYPFIPDGKKKTFSINTGLVFGWKNLR